MFRFYTGFPNYDIFSMVVRFLGRNAASQLVYSNTEQNDAQKKWKNGPKRTLSVEDIWQRLPSKLQNGLQILAARGLKNPSEKCLACLRPEGGRFQVSISHLPFSEHAKNQVLP